MTTRRPRGKLDLDPVTVRKARSLARQVRTCSQALAQPAGIHRRSTLTR